MSLSDFLYSQKPGAIVQARVELLDAKHDLKVLQGVSVYTPRQKTIGLLSHGFTTLMDYGLSYFPVTVGLSVLLWGPAVIESLLPRDYHWSYPRDNWLAFGAGVAITAFARYSQVWGAQNDTEAINEELTEIKGGLEARLPR